MKLRFIIFFFLSIISYPYKGHVYIVDHKRGGRERRVTSRRKGKRRERKRQIWIVRTEDRCSQLITSSHGLINGMQA
jgi:hypothetical protein